MNEEQWSLREVVFVEDVKNVPVGKVCLKYTVPPSLEREGKKKFLLDKLTVKRITVSGMLENISD